MENFDVKRVIVVLKTHLDIGFTAMADKVLDQYCKSFIPAAVDMALKVNRGGDKRFVWTVGSYLPAYYLKRAGEAEKKKFEEAIRAGGIRWHRLPCTTHTELMDRDLFEYGLSIGEKLDEQFGIRTIAAKMTDVPGHTKAIVPLLAEHGVEYLHIGVNASSRVPNVPKLFKWQFEGKEIVVHYAADYGESTVLKCGTALEFFHAHDNQGPPTQEDLEKEWQRLKQKYPNAKIEAGTLDDFARVLRLCKDELPVLTQEIGDTWIHGVGTDPDKVSRYCRLLQMKNEWLASGKLKKEQREYREFMEQLLLVVEHTWGMDAKKYLLDFTNWSKADFTKAREADVTDYDMMAAGKAQEPLAKAMMPELDTYRGVGNCTSSYQLFERSHLEQRQYVERAIAALPEELAIQARRELDWTAEAARVFDTVWGGAKCIPGSAGESRGAADHHFDINGWSVTVGDHGQISHLANPKYGLEKEVSLGLFCYETFGAQTVEACFYDYGRDLDKNLHWAAYDFSKPGLAYAANVRDERFYGKTERISVCGDSLIISLKTEERASEEYGCPRRLVIRHRFEKNRIHTALYFREKDALRSPEALWLQMNLFADGEKWKIKKLGSFIDPENVVSGGGRKLHVCELAAGTLKEAEVKIVPADSPLLSVGKPNLYCVDDSVDSLKGGIWFNLFNNRWGTNFKQWFEEDMRYEFLTEFQWKKAER